MALARWSARRILALWALGIAVEAVLLWTTLSPASPLGPPSVTTVVWIETPPPGAGPQAEARAAALADSVEHALMPSMAPWYALYACIPVALVGLTLAWFWARRTGRRGPSQAAA